MAAILEGHSSMTTGFDLSLIPSGYTDVLVPAEVDQSPYFEFARLPMREMAGPFGLQKFACPVIKKRTNNGDSVHGGFVATLCDHMMGSWVRHYTGMPKNMRPATELLRIDYHKGMKLNDIMYLSAKDQPRRLEGRKANTRIVCRAVIRAEDGQTADVRYEAEAHYIVLDETGKIVKLRDLPNFAML